MFKIVPTNEIDKNHKNVEDTPFPHNLKIAGSNPLQKYNFQKIPVAVLYLLILLQIVPIYFDTLFAARIPLPKGSGKHFFRDLRNNPAPGCLNAVRGGE